jgi:hypothetical protein
VIAYITFYYRLLSPSFTLECLEKMGVGIDSGLTPSERASRLDEYGKVRGVYGPTFSVKPWPSAILGHVYPLIILESIVASKRYPGDY